MDRREVVGYEAGGRPVQLWISNVSPPYQTPRRGSKEKQYRFCFGIGAVQSPCLGRQILNWIPTSDYTSVVAVLLWQWCIKQQSLPWVTTHHLFPCKMDPTCSTAFLFFFRQKFWVKRRHEHISKTSPLQPVVYKSSLFSPQVSNIGKMQKPKRKGTLLGL